MVYLDTHYHYDFLPAGACRQSFLQVLFEHEIQLVAQTLLPSGYQDLVESEQDQALKPLYSIGFHPWWIQSTKQAEQELAIFERLLPTTHLVGEIGLDFSPRRLEQASEKVQVEVLNSILQQVISQSRQTDTFYILSLHSVRSSTVVIDLLEACQVYQSKVIPILHRFNGTSDDLMRHIRLGGYISVGSQMLATKKGRAYAKQIPADRLLLESDLPANPLVDDESTTLAQDQAEFLIHNLQDTVEQLTSIRKDQVLAHIKQTQNCLYGIDEAML
ncbi:TatD family hydrolase [Vaginisenegalia massiliensis]|uniref:TatD family hydrolase n=1 Tax=Vaginisenegalia massiliensis TaxID=2058294 RepID=UPI000F53FDBB|nr:TatD family hydrolase [Vaginisenegalia massiliensis]